MTLNGFLNAGKMSGKLMLLGGMLLLDEAGHAGEDGWALVNTTRSGQIYHRGVGNLSFPWVMIVTVFDAPPARLHAIVTDYNHFSEFIPNVAESRIVEDEAGEQWVYHHLHFPGPVADRVYLISSTDTASRPEENYYRVAWNLTERTFPDIDLTAGISPEVFSGYWELRPGEHTGSTEARYAVYSDPGGFIPGWLVGKMTDRYVQQVVDAIRARLAGGK